MPDPTTIARDHKKIGDELDDIYIEAISAATYAKSYLVHKRGNPNEIFHQFYLPFVALFMHTRFTREMSKDDYTDLINSLDRWVNKGSRTTTIHALLREGLQLFSQYQCEVIKSGAVVIKRE